MLRDVSTRKKTVAICTDLRVRDGVERVRRPTKVCFYYLCTYRNVLKNLSNL